MVLITGASSGVGRSLSYWYLNNGAKVVMVARELTQMDRVAQQYPAQALAVQCDLTDE